MATLKKHSAAAGDIDLQEKYNVLNSKQRSLTELKTHYDSLVSFEEVKQNFLSRVETFAMATTLDMNNNVILNLKDPKLGKEPATKDYADKKLALTGGRMTGAINMGTTRNHEPGKTHRKRKCSHESLCGYGRCKASPQSWRNHDRGN